MVLLDLRCNIHLCYNVVVWLSGKIVEKLL